MAISLLAGCVLAASPAEAAKPAKASKQALIRDALSAAPPTIAKTATVADWDGTVLRKGSGAYHCMPTHPDKRA
ncbi:MAG: hypothetical protein IT561_07605, partial [Alphaproteobacteria bacterium]|nr:hypothetical protein [Alphaproteobacteria bacterium]